MQEQPEGEKPFTLLHVMHAVVSVGILSAIVIPNFIRMQDRAREGSTKANMHTVQLAVEDYGVQSRNGYPVIVGVAGANMPGAFVELLVGGQLLPNAFTRRHTEPRLGPAPDSAEAGSVWYTPRLDSAGTPKAYLIEGFGRNGKLSLSLSSGSAE